MEIGPQWSYTPDGWRQDQPSQPPPMPSQLTAPDVINLVSSGIAHSKSMGYTPIGIQLGLECYRLLLEMAAHGQGDPPRLATMFDLPITMAHDENRAVVRVMVSYIPKS